MAFSLPFFRKRTDKAVKAQPAAKASDQHVPHSNSTNFDLRQQNDKSFINDVSPVAGACDFVESMSDGGRLIRLDSCVDMKLGDLGASSSQPTTTNSKSSQLSKTLDEVLRDKDALAYFISYLKARDSDSLIKFWLAVEAFRLSATDRSHHEKYLEMDFPHGKAQHQSVPQTVSVTDNSDLNPEKLSSRNDFSSSQSVASDNQGVAAKRTPSNDCGHFGAVGDSPEFVGRVRAHGEIPSMRRNFAMDDGKNLNVDRIIIDHCSASDPHRKITDCPGIGSTEACSRSMDFSETAGDEMSAESIQKGIERDAVAIFSKYLSPDCPHPVHVTERLRERAVHQMCREDGRGVDPECFTECQQFVFEILATDHFPGFRQSVYHCKHQIDVLTGSQISLNDVLYDDTSFSYFTEFMEGEHASVLLQCFLDLDNFHQLLVNTPVSSPTDPMNGSKSSCSGPATSFNVTQDDAIVIYNKYFSLQATRCLRFDDGVRQEVELNICRDDGPAADCFSTPRQIVYCHLERTYLPLFLKSELYFKYLSDLIGTVQLAQDTVVFPRRRRASDSNSERSVSSAGNDSVSTRNTLLAMDTRGQHIKKAVTKIGDDLRIDASLFDPEHLWKRPVQGTMRLGRVNELGQFISEFDPEPDREKKGLGLLFSRRSEKARIDEEMALQVAQMIINDVTSTTLGNDLDFQQ